MTTENTNNTNNADNNNSNNSNSKKKEEEKSNALTYAIGIGSGAGLGGGVGYVGALATGNDVATMMILGGIAGAGLGASVAHNIIQNEELEARSEKLKAAKTRSANLSARLEAVKAKLAKAKATPPAPPALVETPTAPAIPQEVLDAQAAAMAKAEEMQRVQMEMQTAQLQILSQIADKLSAPQPAPAPQAQFDPFLLQALVAAQKSNGQSVAAAQPVVQAPAAQPTVSAPAPQPAVDPVTEAAKEIVEAADLETPAETKEELEAKIATAKKKIIKRNAKGQFSKKD